MVFGSAKFVLPNWGHDNIIVTITRECWATVGDAPEVPEIEGDAFFKLKLILALIYAFVVLIILMVGYQTF